MKSIDSTKGLEMRLLAVLIMGMTVTHAAPAQERLGGVEEVWTTKGPQSALFASVAGMVEAPDGSVIISDTNNHTLYSFEPETESFTIFDLQGEGPGDLQLPTLVTLSPSGEIAVYDIGRMAILQYDSSLVPKRDVRLRETITNPKGFAYLKDGTFVISGGRMDALLGSDTVFAVHHYSSEGELLRSYVPQPPFENRRASLQSAGGPVSQFEDGFLYSNSAPHEILRFDGNLVAHTIAEDEDVLEPIVDRFASERLREDGRTVITYQWFYDQSRAIFERADGRLLNIITRQYRGDSLWEVWEKDGTLVDRLRVPRAYRPFALTQAGDVLAVYEDPADSNQVATALRVIEQHRRIPRLDL